MRFTQSWLAVGALVIALVLPGTSSAKPSLEARLAHIEAVLENKINVDTITSIETMRNELQQLRGKLDEQQYALEQLTKRQEKLFLDLEQRIEQNPKTTSNASPYSDFKAGKPVNIKLNTASTTNSAQTTANSSNTAAITAEKVPTNTAAATPATTAVTAESASKIKAAKTAATKTDSSETDTYNAAYKLVELKKYQDAEVALQDFLWQFPEGKYAANAHYWLGEIYLASWHNDHTKKLSLEKAVSSFKTVTNKYAQHHKAADSLLKLGIIATEQNNNTAAVEYFNRLKQQYPGSSRAHMADLRLKNLQRQ